MIDENLNIPLTKWNNTFSHFDTVVNGELTNGTVREPVLVDVHKTKFSKFAVTANIEGEFYEFQLQIDRGKAWNKHKQLTLRCINGKGKKTAARGNCSWNTRSITKIVFMIIRQIKT